MKLKFNLWFMTAIVCGLGMSIVSCEDDDKLSSEEKKAQEEQKAEEKATAFWDVVSQLVSIDDVTDDYQDKTFEPTYGIEDSTNSVYRIVYTNDMATAAMRFANLVGAKDVNEDTESYQWSDPEIGSMTYTRGGTAANWATVDVDIKQIPHLQKIIYRAGGEGENGKFDGRAYYRFGDVVSRQVTVKYDQKKNNDNRGTITEYWICVRPSFGPEGKEDSHWVCVNTVSDKNYKYYKASTGTDYWLPTKIGTDKENMQNFAELLWAICYPEQWFNNVFNHHTDGTLWGFDGVPFFTDFKGANLKYHNQYFWENVRKGWEDKQVVEKALNLPDIGTLADLIPSNGVRLLYWGYSWIFTTSWDCELHEAIYTNGSEEAELNMHRVDYKEDWDVNMKNIKFDVRAMGKNKENYKDYFNNDGKTRWVIRHATGKELAANKKYDVKQPINGVEEVYRYYRDVEPVNNLTFEPEITEDYQKMIFTERGYYNTGDVVIDERGNKWICVQPSGYQKENNLLGDYAYFVSFDQGAVGTNLENIPTSKNLLLQIMFDMGIVYHNNLIGDGLIGYWGRIATNMKNYGGVDINELYAARDSTVTHRNDNTPSQEINDFLNLLYREDGQICIMRGIGDYTHDQVNGGREWSWYFWSRYTKTPERKMFLSDLADQNMINTYKEDPWVYNTWYDNKTKQKVRTNMGPRTQTEAITPLTRFIYQPGRTAMAGTAPANMYREPICAVAVKRVMDRGAAKDKFEDNTKFFPVRLMKEVGEAFRDDEMITELETMVVTYMGYVQQTMFVDGEHYEFGLNN